MNLLNAWGGRALYLLLAIILSLFAQEAAFSATKYAAPNGRSGNSGNSATSPWDAKSCMSQLSPGDTCIYLAGNYGDTQFEPRNNGTRNAKITHRCDKRHACLFDRLKFDGNQFLEIVNIASDSHYYDSSKSYSTPRMLVRDSHDLRFDSIYVRGEPQQCANGNPGPGCSGNSKFNRYNDLVRIGDSNFPEAVSYRIEISGASEFINGNHSVIQFFDDGDSQFCEDDESDIWIHGTPAIPIRFSSKYHHIMSFKGACRVLVEYVDFGPSGNGRGDLTQPANSEEQQTGGIIHGSTIRNTIVRYSNFTKGGSATNQSRNGSHFEIGMFGRGVDGACFPHNSHFRSWGALANLGRFDDIPYVRNASIINNAVAEGWYMLATNRRAATSPYAGYLLSRSGLETRVSIDVDGLAVDSVSAQNGLLYAGANVTHSFADAPFQSGGITVGRTVYNNLDNLFRAPATGDYRPVTGSRLIGSAVPVAQTTSSGSGNTVPVDRAECFAGTLGGMRAGDQIVIGNAACTVTKTNLQNGSISCSQNISWDNGDAIYYKNSDGTMRDIGSRSRLSPYSSPDDSNRPKPPAIELE